MIFQLTLVILSILARYQFLVLSLNQCQISNNSLHEVIQLFQEVQISSGSSSLTLKKSSDHESKILDVYANYIGEKLVSREHLILLVVDSNHIFRLGNGGGE